MESSPCPTKAKGPNRPEKPKKLPDRLDPIDTRPALYCNRCQCNFDVSSNLPIQSTVCCHSICSGCLDNIAQTSPNRAVACHNCQAPNAFHTETRNINLLACAAIDLIRRREEYWDGHLDFWQAKTKELESLAKSAYKNSDALDTLESSSGTLETINDQNKVSTDFKVLKKKSVSLDVHVGKKEVSKKEVTTTSIKNKRTQHLPPKAPKAKEKISQSDPATKTHSKPRLKQRPKSDEKAAPLEASPRLQEECDDSPNSVESQTTHADKSTSVNNDRDVSPVGPLVSKGPSMARRSRRSTSEVPSLAIDSQPRKRGRPKEEAFQKPAPTLKRDQTPTSRQNMGLSSTNPVPENNPPSCRWNRKRQGGQTVTEAEGPLRFVNASTRLCRDQTRNNGAFGFQRKPPKCRGRKRIKLNDSQAKDMEPSMHHAKEDEEPNDSATLPKLRRISTRLSRLSKSSFPC